MAKALEDRLQPVGRDPAARVPDREARASLFGIGRAGRDRDRAQAGRELDRVAEQVHEHLDDPIGVDRDRQTLIHVGGHRQAVLRGVHLDDLDRIRHQRGGPDRGELELHGTRVHALNVEHVVDQADQPVGVGHGELEHALGLRGQLAEDAALQQAERAADRGQRCAQLVSNHRDELVLDLLAFTPRPLGGRELAQRQVLAGGDQPPDHRQDQDEAQLGKERFVPLHPDQQAEPDRRGDVRQPARARRGLAPIRHRRFIVRSGGSLL